MDKTKNTYVKIKKYIILTKITNMHRKFSTSLAIF